MKMRWMTTAILAAAVALAPAWGFASDKSASKMPSGDRKFVMEALKGGMAEVELGKLASERASNDAVKRSEAERIRTAIIDEAWDPQLRSLTEHLGGGGLDASLLSLPLRRVVPADHPRMIATTQAVRQRLGAGKHGLLYRYLPDESPDGLPGHEGAFLLCSFWLVDNLVPRGRVDEAVGLFESLCARATPLGLLPEQIDPTTGAFLGNFPQAFSHVGLIASGINLVRALGDQRR